MVITGLAIPIIFSGGGFDYGSRPDNLVDILPFTKTKILKSHRNRKTLMSNTKKSKKSIFSRISLSLADIAAMTLVFLLLASGALVGLVLVYIVGGIIALLGIAVAIIVLFLGTALSIIIPFSIAIELTREVNLERQERQEKEERKTNRITSSTSNSQLTPKQPTEKRRNPHGRKSSKRSNPRYGY